MNSAANPALMSCAFAPDLWLCGQPGFAILDLLRAPGRRRIALRNRAFGQAIGHGVGYQSHANAPPVW